MTKRCDEFVVVWFESTQTWMAFSSDGCDIGMGGSVGQATINAMQLLNVAEADFDCVDDYGDFYRYVRYADQPSQTVCDTTNN